MKKISFLLICMFFVLSFIVGVKAADVASIVFRSPENTAANVFGSLIIVLVLIWAVLMYLKVRKPVKVKKKVVKKNIKTKPKKKVKKKRAKVVKKKVRRRK